MSHWKQWWNSQTKSTIVLSRTRFEGQHWRRGKKPSKDSGNRDESSSDKRENIPCRYRNCNNPSCSYWHFPACQNHKSQTGCKHGNKCCFRHVEADEKPSKKSKNGGAKGTVALLIESFQFELCVSRSSSEKIYSTERRKIGIETRRQILQGHLAPNKNSGKKGSIAMDYSKVCAS